MKLPQKMVKFMSGKEKRSQTFCAILPHSVFLGITRKLTGWQPGDLRSGYESEYKSFRTPHPPMWSVGVRWPRSGRPWYRILGYGSLNEIIQ
jgi:hypothetical protein